MTTAEPRADTRMRASRTQRSAVTGPVRLMLTATPATQVRQRQAVADQLLWLMQALHAHHTAEDSGLWPLVRQRNPAATQLLSSEGGSQAAEVLARSLERTP